MTLQKPEPILVNDLILFTDGSVDTKTHIGFGAYLAVDTIEISLIDCSAKVKVKKFENTSSTVLELQALLWAIDDAISFGKEEITKLIIYSDSQNILSLLARRKKLEAHNYFSANGKKLKNAKIYNIFYEIIDQYDCYFFKVDGHNPEHVKNNIDKIFALVDKASRHALRHFRYENIIIK